ncbi:hypothetical protein C9417_25145 [Rhizobium sp. SEMIA 4088]|nr:hypothetical protein C9417_25145 [Rhizobium sp. SEMIA 4088]
MAIADPFGDGRHTNHAVPPLYGSGTARYSLTSARSAYIEGDMTGKRRPMCLLDAEGAADIEKSA